MQKDGMKPRTSGILWQDSLIVMARRLIARMQKHPNFSQNALGKMTGKERESFEVQTR